MMNYELFEKLFIGIVKDAVFGEDNTEIPPQTDLDALTEMIKMHKLTTLLYPLLEKRGIKITELYKDFSFWAAVEANQQYYLEKIKERFEAEKIRFLCIKGAYLKTIYPEPYMRSSNDIDIFVDDENTEKVRDIMVSLGFSVKRFSHNIQDDVYTLGEFVYVEIHRELISNKCPWSEKCNEIIDRIVPKTQGSYEYLMTKEDFYLHMIAHMAKHFKYSGCGIRMVLDIWIYLDKFGNDIDRETLDRRLKECGLDIFEREVKKLTEYWFCGRDADNKTKAFAGYIFGSGLFGSTEQLLATEMSEIGKTGAAKRLVKNLFLPYGNMCIIFPRLSKYPVLLPFYWILRAFNVIIFKRGRIAEETKIYDGINTDYARKISEFKKSMGL